jgi:hypothetical protein
MADLNALIAQGYQFQPLPDPFAQYGKMQQLENSATQNRLAQQQMQENAQLAPLRMQETQARLNKSNLDYEQAREAKDYVAKVMSVAAEHGGPTDPFEAAKQMVAHPNPQIQLAGKHLLDSYQLIQGIEQQKRYEQRAPSSTGFAAPAAAPTAAYMPTSAQGTLGGPTAVMPGALGSGTFDVNAPAPVANAFAQTVPSVNAFRPGAVTAESVAEQIRQGNKDFGNAPGWAKDREILMKQYEALLNPRQRTFAPIDASKYTPESIRAFNLSGDQSDLVAITPKNNVFSTLNPKDYTQDSIRAFNASGDYADLIPKEKSDKTVGNINAADFTPASVQAFSASGNYADLVPKPTPDKKVGNINAADFTPTSVQAFNASGNYADLVPKPIPAKEDKIIANINAADYTPASVQAFSASGNYADLVPKPSVAKENKLINNINPDSYTGDSIEKFLRTGSYTDLVKVDKTSKSESSIAKVDVDKFTPASVAKYAQTNNYADLVPVPPKPTAAGGQGKPPTGYRWDKSGENLEKIPGGPADKEEKLKPIPPNINTAIGTNNISIGKIEEALDLLKKYPDAIGLKALLPGQALDRADPKGVAARSAIGDIGSLVIHDRSGAAVSQSEMQRLGFIPTPTDRADNAKTKLEAMLRWAKAGQQGLSETYSESQGYKPNPTFVGKNKAAPANVSNW